jgi:hypothetical protein
MEQLQQQLTMAVRWHGWQLLYLVQQLQWCM